jgi:hypothetical protein
MQPVFVALLAAALLAAASGAAQASGTVTLTGELSASLGAMPVAVGGFRATLAEGRYQVSGHGRTAGMGRLFSSGEARVEASGRLSRSAALPAGYRHELKAKRDWDRVAIAFSGGRVARVAIEPPPRPRPDRVPLGEEHLRQVLDPLSAVMLLSAGPAGPEICERTLPIFDGEQRYDLQMSFKRTERVGGPRGSYSGPAYVCGIRYFPVAGHRPGRNAIRYLERNDGMEIWMAAVGEQVIAPVRARVPTPFGTLTLSATRLSIQ